MTAVGPTFDQQEQRETLATKGVSTEGRRPSWCIIEQTVPHFSIAKRPATEHWGLFPNIYIFKNPELC